MIDKAVFAAMKQNTILINYCLCVLSCKILSKYPLDVFLYILYILVSIILNEVKICQKLIGEAEFVIK